ncbi:MAG: hypothetical protein C5B59_07340 [Bacteroidetes bacterium]|nr:MAG: hypothetical protein C5B59_07340 [Bacteroidota bacterium]
MNSFAAFDDGVAWKPFFEFESTTSARMVLYVIEAYGLIDCQIYYGNFVIQEKFYCRRRIKVFSAVLL